MIQPFTDRVRRVVFGRGTLAQVADGLDQAADLAVAAPLDRTAVRALLQATSNGTAPQ